MAWCGPLLRSDSGGHHPEHDAAVPLHLQLHGAVQPVRSAACVGAHHREVMAEPLGALHLQRVVPRSRRRSIKPRRRRPRARSHRTRSTSMPSAGWRRSTRSISGRCRGPSTCRRSKRSPPSCEKCWVDGSEPVPLGVLQRVQPREPEQPKQHDGRTNLGRITSAGSARTIQFAVTVLY